jgi:hypothetical protein
MAATIKLEKKLGIIIHNNASLFSNGIIQNAYFLHQCCEAAGYTCQLLCPEPNPSPFEHKGFTLRQITTDPTLFQPAEYHTIVLVTRDISNEVYALLKANHVSVVTLVCGNNYMYDQEDFVKGLTGNVNKYLGASRNIDEQWLIPSYRYAIDYMEIIRKKPAYIVPHLWSSELVSKTHAESSLFYNIGNRKTKKINIVIMEPNLNYFKTAWMPIIAAEKLHTMFPDLVEGVYVYNFPSHSHASWMTSVLSLGDKLHKVDRLSMAEIMHKFNNETTATPIFVSHQVLNHLNYLYYELLYYGYPLIHNSTMLDGCGYHFPENNVARCVEQILYAHTHHDKGVETYKTKAHEYLKLVDPLNTSVQKAFDQMITAGIINNTVTKAR